MRFNLEKLKDIPIKEVALELGIDVMGNKAMCFFGHDRKTPSLNFNVNKNYWHCFSCEAGGDSIKLAQDFLNTDFIEACKWLSDKFNIEISGFQPSKKKLRVTLKRNHNALLHDDHHNIDLEVYKWLIDSGSISKKAYDYLVNTRGFSNDTLEYFNIKDIEHPNKKFIDAKKMWGIERLLRSGLARKSESGLTNFIWWNHIILFPFYNQENQITYIQGRQLGEKEPKYINLKGIKTQIYNLKVIQSLNKNDLLYICEGTIDVLSAYQKGLNAIGIIGATGFKEEWTNYFINYRVRVLPDSDLAGDKFASIIEKYFNKIGKNIEIVKLPAGKDFSEFLKMIKN